MEDVIAPCCVRGGVERSCACDDKRMKWGRLEGSCKVGEAGEEGGVVCFLRVYVLGLIIVVGPGGVGALGGGDVGAIAVTTFRVIGVKLRRGGSRRDGCDE